MLQKSSTVQILASVKSMEEAKTVLSKNIDIIDLKNPARGALGAVDYLTASSIVGFVNKQILVSATIGDIPEMHPRLIAEKVRQMSTTNVDVIKVGFFQSPLIGDCIDHLSEYTKQGVKIVAVFFADQWDFDLAWISKLAAKGFCGAMLDTANKESGTLVNHVSIEVLNNFIVECKRNGLVSGLAGSLRLEDISELSALSPNYLGFRGALCDGGRNGSINPNYIDRLQTAMHAHS